MIAHRSLLVAGAFACLIAWLVTPGDSDWTPYQVGAAIGVLSWLTFSVSDKPIGASSAYANIAGFLGRRVAPGHTEKLKYYKDNPPSVDWGTVFLGAAFVGAFLSAITSGQFQGEWMSSLWVERFGSDSLVLRLATALIGGMIMAIGARLAGGCTSGHGISGTMQLALGSWLFFFSLFAGGTVTAFILFGGAV